MKRFPEISTAGHSSGDRNETPPPLIMRGTNWAGTDRAGTDWAGNRKSLELLHSGRPAKPQN